MINKKRIQIQATSRHSRLLMRLKTKLESHYGIGKIQSKLICNQLGISLNLRNSQITKYERKKIMDYLRKRMRIINEAENISPQDINKTSIIGSNKYSHEVKMVNKINNTPIVDNLKYIQTNNIRDLIKKNTYKGFRHKKGLPVRGQRTKTNRQTRRRLSRKRI
jgi:ribosomal protein S13